ncbi:hypothetical protein [Burkholderia sp. Ac-20353]|uniref:hypothetical protein n=1 Tax=Burkholderia sp. Ac-20353 TaxID=2703894 RepID=UPI00197BB272|nr:hypothetical protein [Burkholderia sp. Ac-20353]MBN3785514.1 hypothetical protein [Burkholderia sp. Ac-20353]
MSLVVKKVARSKMSAHQLVHFADAPIGEVWREQVSVVVSKLTEPRRMATKWRWFAKQAGSSVTLGRGTRAAMLLGPGFKGKDEAISVLLEACGLNRD